MYVRANHKQKSSVKDNTSHPVWDPEGKAPFVFAVRCAAAVMLDTRLAGTCQESRGCTRFPASPDKCLPHASTRSRVWGLGRLASVRWRSLAGSPPDAGS